MQSRSIQYPELKISSGSFQLGSNKKIILEIYLRSNQYEINI